MASFRAELTRTILLAMALTEPVIASTDGPEMGICVHLHGASKAAIDQALAAASAAHMHLIRWDAPWSDVEKSPGVLKVPASWDYIVRSANTLGIKSDLILDYGNKYYDGGDKPLSSSAQKAFVRYTGFIASHFSTSVKYYEVWNEWNGRVGNTKPGTLRDYQSLFNAACPIIHSSAKGSQVIAGNFSTSVFNSLVREGDNNPDFENYMNGQGSPCADIIGIHPYNYYRHGNLAGGTGFGKLMGAVMASIHRSNWASLKPVWITEVGWSTSPRDNDPVDENAQARLLKLARSLAKHYNITSLIVYELFDGPNAKEPEGGFGIFRYDRTPKVSGQQFVGGL